MKYQVGDEILVLHSNEEGRVIEILNDKMVMIEVRGVKFPAYMDQIDFPYFKRFTEKKLVPDKKPVKKFIDDVRREKPKAVDRVVDGLWLSFLPVLDTDEFGDDVVEQLKVHLVNRTAEGLNFEYNLQFFGESGFSLKSEIPAFSDFYLHDVPFEDMNDSPNFHFELSLTQPQKNKAEFFETSLKLKPKQLFKRVEELKAKNEASFTYRLMETYPERPAESFLDFSALSNAGYKVYEASKARQHLEPARSVIDLHIERLTDDWKNMTPFEMLTLQLNIFEKYYELALQQHQPTLTVIHGVGKGKLRNELHDILRLKKEVKTFVNQYHPNFGYGATEIYFQY